uniref:Uncharacterized protein n=1 Tax=Vitis vinifera TaxID=29760 RepID=A5BVS3_VITVI|nr:hypothetical protein VITISV_010604 [Vitis vinifera]
MAKDVRTGRPDTPSEGGRTWVVAGYRNDVARLAHFRYAIVWGVMFTSAMCFSLGNPDVVALDSDARSVSSGGGVPTPCTRKRSPLRARHISFHPGRNSVRPTFHLLRISHIRNSVRSDMSGSSNRISHIRRLTSDGRGGLMRLMVA